MAKRQEKKKDTVTLPLLEELISLDESYMNSETGWRTPDYLAQNMVHTLRDYQSDALRFFHYSQASDMFLYRNVNHVLFNMATGSGKTDVMAALILYMYQELNYQNFLFIVNTNSVLTKTIDNLTNESSAKYLYRPTLEIDGERLTIEKVDVFPHVQSKNTLYIKLASVQRVATDIFTQSENSMGKDDYARHQMVILGDEAHHYSASTKSEKELEQSWEKAIDIILSSRKDNRLLEFTATIDLDNKHIYQKYKDKVIYQYTLDRFILDKYSKNVKRIQSSNTDRENMLNVVLLSEYRRHHAMQAYHTKIKPVIMFKSQKIAGSNEANQLFNDVIDSLTPDLLIEFLSRQSAMQSQSNSETLSIALDFYRQNGEKLPDIVREIKREFSPSRIINANDSDRGAGMLEKGHYAALNSLESPSNIYRVVFAVAKLTEGWDVLNLYDIVRISNPNETKGDKKSTMAEAQLIGRGARYNPFKIDGKQSYKRRFDESSEDVSSLMLETLHYHTINEPQYLKNLIEALDKMNLPTEEDSKNPLIDVKVKRSFSKTDVWKNGMIYYNQTIEVEDSYYTSLDKYGIDNQSDVVIPWRYTSQEMNYMSESVGENYSETHQLPITFDKRYLNKAMNRLRFFHFDNLKRYVPKLKSRDEFFSPDWLNVSNRTFYAVAPITFTEDQFTAVEKLTIFETYLQDVAMKLKSNFNKYRGTNHFVGYPVKEYIADYRKRVPNYDTSTLLLSRNPQNVERHEIKNPAFVYDSAIINDTEKQLVDRILERVDELKKEYEDVYLIRMDENMHRESAKNDKLKLHQFEEHPTSIHFEGFQPDFILYLNKPDYFMQIFIEPKGNHLLEKDQWKEDLLLYINENEGELVFEDEIDGVRIKGLKFYTLNDGRGALKQLAQIAMEKEFKGLSMNN